ncbi:hypothetical protein K8R47_02995 [archaeon]|nr:hypothetical protein [archaeon]
MKNKDWILVGINVVLISLIFANSFVFLGNPNNNDRITGRVVQFNWEGAAEGYTILIDDNEEFTSPIIKEVTNNSLELDLKPGTYYWKVQTDNLESPVWKFYIDTEVVINLETGDESLKIINKGNDNLNLEIRNEESSEFLELEYQESLEFEISDSEFIVRQE